MVDNFNSNYDPLNECRISFLWSYRTEGVLHESDT